MRRTSTRPDRTDGGFSLVELLVAMGIFTLVLGIFMSGVLVMYRDVNRSQAVATTSDALRKTFTTMDRQVRYAEGVNHAGLVNGSYYVEFRTPSGGGNPAQCYQWRYAVSAGTLSYRTWTATATAGTTWTPVAAGLRTDLTESPFTMLKAVSTGTSGDVSYTKQRLAVAIAGARGGGSEQMTTTFVASNSSIDAPGNKDVNVPGVSDSPVCTPGTTRS
ncbi:PulJ/GspJ family protein [Kineococcus glutinatus]|uniref:Prepilin-type N-terminal cleavage/methylation domain-containing protein n=1 Tax=Kineococcus glutinatus TaxID=1070872 RepID=A0ABP9HCT7_9ACTN